MQLLDALGGATNNGIELLHEVHRHNTTDIAERTGVPVHIIASFQRTATVFYGATDSPRKQAEAVTAARHHGHGVWTLQMIVTESKKLRDPAARWPFRLEMCQTAGSYEKVRDAARARVQELNALTPEPVVEETIRVGRNRTSITYIGDPRLIADLERHLRQGLDRSKPESIQMGARFREFVRGTDNKDNKDNAVAAAQLRPIVRIELDDYIRLRKGHNGTDCHIQVSDGTWMSGAEYIAQQLDDIEVLLVHPTEGPVDLYRTQRLANTKQRDILRAEHTRCCWPGCHKPADYSDIHHVTEWKDGGETNLSNLMVLCKYHNGINGHPGRGRMVYVGMKPTWIPT